MPKAVYGFSSIPIKIQKIFSDLEKDSKICVET